MLANVTGFAGLGAEHPESEPARMPMLAITVAVFKPIDFMCYPLFAQSMFFFCESKLLHELVEDK